MPVTEARRIALLEAAQQHLGREVTITLMEMLPPSGWGDVATRQRVDALEHALHRRFDAMDTKYDARFDAMEVRFDAADTRTDAIASAIRAEMRASSAEIRTEIAQLRVTTNRWAIGVMVSMAAV